MFPLDQWYVAGFSWEFETGAIARTLLGQPVVLFRAAGKVSALEDKCAHRHLPLSCGTLEPAGIRCGYHGLLFDGNGQCVEIQSRPSFGMRNLGSWSSRGAQGLPQQIGHIPQANRLIQ